VTKGPPPRAAGACAKRPPGVVVRPPRQPSVTTLFEMRQSLDEHGDRETESVRQAAAGQYRVVVVCIIVVGGRDALGVKERCYRRMKLRAPKELRTVTVFDADWGTNKNDRKTISSHSTTLGELCC